MNDIVKPLVIPDIESTGLNKETDHIIQFAALKVDRTTGKLIDSINLYIRPIGSYTITIQAYLRHHIKPEDLADKPTFPEVAQQIKDFFHYHVRNKHINILNTNDIHAFRRITLY